MKAWMPQFATLTLMAATLAACAGSPAPKPDTSDAASIRRAAQQVANTTGCTDLLTVSASSYLAKCATYSVAIECEGTSCHTTRTQNNGSWGSQQIR
jgi:hypothetical protein